MKFIGYKWLWLTKTFGIHICWKGRIDIHFWTGMLSIGKVPIYMYVDIDKQWRSVAVSNSYHEGKLKKERKSRPIRAGVPL